MSIKNQATFWLRNVNEYSGEYSSFPDFHDGYRALSNLMKRIYEDYRSYEISTAEKVRTKIGIMADDLENYHNLMETIDCIYQMAAVGVFGEEGNVNNLEIEKAAFKKTYKSSVTFPFQMLGNYGFYFKYFKNNKEVSSYKNCENFYLFYDENAELISIMKHIVESLPDINAKDDYIGKKNLLFSITDFKSILLKNSTKQKDMNPLKSGIVNTAGTKNELWNVIVEKFVNEMKLTVRAYINPYVFPNWTVILLNKNKTIITFTLTPDVIYVVLFLSYEAAKELIKEKEKLPKIIKDSIKHFGCNGCGKCSNQVNIEIFEGVKLCKKATFALGGGEGRRIDGEIVSSEEVSVIYDIVKKMYI